MAGAELYYFSRATLVALAAMAEGERRRFFSQFFRGVFKALENLWSYFDVESSSLAKIFGSIAKTLLSCSNELLVPSSEFIV